MKYVSGYWENFSSLFRCNMHVLMLHQFKVGWTDSEFDIMDKMHTKYAIFSKYVLLN